MAIRGFATINTTTRYRETSDFGDPDDDVDERFGGFHSVGGAEYQPLLWLAVRGELVWSSISNALVEAVPRQRSTKTLSEAQPCE